MSILLKSNDMTTAPIYKSIITFAIPIALSNLFQQLYCAVDAAVLGAFVGKEAMAATTVSTIINLMICLFVGVGSGAGVVVSRYYGAKDGDGVSRAVHTSVAVSFISGAVLTAIGVAVSRPALLLMHFDAVIDLSDRYLKIIFAGMIAKLTYNIGAGILRAVGDSRRTFYYLVAGGVTNIVLDVLFVAVFRWSVAGAALATVLAEAVSAALCILRLMRTDGSYKLVWKKIRIHKTMLLSFIKIGVPMGLFSMAYSLPNTLLQASVNTFGVEAMAGGTAYSKIGTFIDMVLASVETAVTTFVSQNIGARKYDRVKKGSRAGLVIGMIGVAVMMVIVALLTRPVVGALVDHDELSISYGILKMTCILPFYPAAAFTGVLGAVMQGGGASLQIMIQGLIFTCVIRLLIVTFVLPFYHEIYIIYLTYPFTWILQGISYAIYYKFGKWMKTKI